MKPEESSLHPANDPRLLARHETYTDRPANDAEYLYRLADKMETDTQLRQVVYQKFYDGDLEFLMHDGQVKIWNKIKDNPDAAEVLILCSRQLGKSFVGLLIAIMHLCQPYGKRRPMVRMFCETQDQIKDIVQDNMDLILMIAPPGFIIRTKSEKRYRISCGELRLGLLSGARVNGKRGGNATLIITEESGFSPSETFKDAVENVLSPQLLRSEGKMIHITTSSKDEMHYVHRVIQPKTQDAGTFCNLTVYENPQLTDRQIIKAFEKVFDGTVEGWSREYLVKVVRSAMLTVVPEFIESVIQDSKEPGYAYWLTSIDFGGTKDKHGIILGYHDFKRAKDVVLAESLLDINTGTDKIIETAENLESDYIGMSKISHFRKVDAAGQLLVDLRAEGFKCSLPSKATGSFEAGVNQIRVSFIKETLEIHPRCKNLIKALRYGKLNKKRADFERHEEFGHLDILAALIYFLRHLNRSNPYPDNIDKTGATHHIREKEQKSSESIKKILNIF